MMHMCDLYFRMEQFSVSCKTSGHNHVAADFLFTYRQLLEYIFIINVKYRLFLVS